MSTTTKKASTKGIRYTDAQKKEVTDFALKYNADNGRGGQSKAAEKFNISPLTVATWMKAGSASPKASKASGEGSDSSGKSSKASKKGSKSGGKGRSGSRYTDEQKQEVTDFVATYNSQNGRGGASVATKKFGISPLTVSAWLKAAGISSKGKKIVAPKGSSGKAASASAAVGGMSAKLNRLLELSDEIAAAEAELLKLTAKFASLKASL